jgi:hypothetical protein
MIIIKKQLKKILGLAAIGAVLIGAVVGGISVRDRNGSKDKSIQTHNDSKDQSSLELTSKLKTKKICKKFFEENEQEAIIRGYSQKDVIDCSFAGCGTLYK